MEKTKQIAIRLSPTQIKELKQFCLNNDINMTTAIKAGVYLLKNSKQIENKITVSVDVEDLKKEAGI